MCMRKCEYADTSGICSYARVMENTEAKYHTRTATIAAALGMRPDAPEVRNLLKGENCPLFCRKGTGRQKERVALTLRIPAEREKTARKKEARQPESPAERYVPPVPEECLYGEYELGKVDREIAETLGIQTYQVGLWRRGVGLPSNREKGMRNLDGKRAEELYREGLPDTEIGRRLGVSSQMVNRWRQANGLPANVKMFLTKEDREERWTLYHAGMTDSEIAEATGVNRTTIEKWRHAHKLTANHKREKEDTA